MINIVMILSLIRPQLGKQRVSTHGIGVPVSWFEGSKYSSFHTCSELVMNGDKYF